MDMVKVSAIGVVGVLLAVSLKSHKTEYGVYVALAVCFVMLEYIVRYFTQILSGMDTLRGYLRGNYSYLALLLKAVGATYACEFCAGICKDAGYGGVAGNAWQDLYTLHGDARASHIDGEHTVNCGVGYGGAYIKDAAGGR